MEFQEQLKRRKLWTNSFKDYLVLPTNIMENIEEIARILGTKTDPETLKKDGLQVILDNFSLWETDLTMDEGRIPILDESHAPHARLLIAHQPYESNTDYQVGPLILREYSGELKAGAGRLPDMRVKVWKSDHKGEADLYTLAKPDYTWQKDRNCRLYTVSLHIKAMKEKK